MKLLSQCGLITSMKDKKDRDRRSFFIRSFFCGKEQTCYYLHCPRWVLAKMPEMRLTFYDAGGGGGVAHTSRYKMSGKYGIKHRVYRVQAFFTIVQVGSPQSQVATPPPTWVQGGRHTRLRGTVWGDPIPTKGQALWYSVYYNPSMASSLDNGHWTLSP